MNVFIVFHSVCGNTYFIADAFKQAFEKLNHSVVLKRVADEDFDVWKNIFPCANEFADKINALDTATTDDLLSADLILMGSPTYYGNVSAEMKRFMDSTVSFFTQQPLCGKHAVFFSSGGSCAGGSVFCLDAMIRFAQHNGMIPISLPPSVQEYSPEISAYGICHVSGDNALCRPDISLQKGIHAIACHAEKIITGQKSA